MKSLFSPVSTLVRVTVVPTSAAPEESVTVPRMSPEFVLCASTPLVVPNTTKSNTAKRNTLFILLSSSNLRVQMRSPAPLKARFPRNDRTIHNPRGCKASHLLQPPALDRQTVVLVTS